MRLAGWTSNQTIVAERRAETFGRRWWCWWWVLGGAPTRCSESDSRMIYGVNEMITGIVLRRLEKSRVLSIYRGSPGGPIEAEKICMLAEKICIVESDRGKWVVKSAFGIVKHGVRGITSLNGAWDLEATWRFNHSIFGRVSYGLRPRPIIPRSRGREDSAFTSFCFLGRQNA
ncbi:unnamed protein product [Prunus brigantina]